METKKNVIHEKEIWIFLSHSNEDYEKVRRVRNFLEEQNLRPIMFFLKCLNDDDEIDDLIKREIDCRTRFILCDSENARRSKWVQREIEYIEKKEKPYEIIDLSQNDEEIKAQLEEVKRKTNIFIIYARENQYIADAVYERLSKYDYSVFIGKNNFLLEDDYATTIKQNLKKVANNGYVIAIISDHTLNAKYAMEEMGYAKSMDKQEDGKIDIIPIIIGNNTPAACKDLPNIQFVRNTDDIANKVTDAILQKIMHRSQILTYYFNFKKGINRKQDLYEAERLGNIFFEIVDKLDSQNYPPGSVELAHCYEEGIGTEIDLEKAYLLYSDPVSTDGMCREDAKRVRKLLAEKYPDKWDIKPTTISKWQLAKNMFRALFVEIPQDAYRFFFKK